ncbi:dTDP-4-dehydrorhamnose 3,5-epimerase [Acuticoccus sediminis]|uniref:dTDP-4-dehydrorhamnose 3,5-epimerase n=1 Tax=Acuticoccus sediminis TaxID=2184697 RepID=UPI001CFF2FA2|nr:dTDP-4-dehydrorhamnose 3,5-epimerase [Acuticoccus sediminis]
MDCTPLRISDVILLQPKRFEDDRGWFQETWNARTLEKNGITLDFVQDNQSLSRKAGTVRGLHLQVAPYAQAKLVRVVVGAIIDVAVDIREGSPTYGQWVSAELSAENGAQLLVPRGFAHGFRTLVPDTEVCYKVDGFYDRASERGIRYDDPELGIDWGPEAEILLSEKDKVLPLLKDLGPVSF